MSHINDSDDHDDNDDNDNEDNVELLEDNGIEDVIGDSNTIVADEYEIRGWIWYDWALAPFFTVGIAFLSLLVTAHAKEVAETLHGYKLEDANHNACTTDGDGSCGRVPLKNGVYGGIDYASLIQVVTSISVVIQTIIFVSAASISDYSNYRRVFFIVLTTVGSFSMVCAIFEVNASLYWLGCCVLLVSNVAYGWAHVIQNGYLAVLVNAHHELYNQVIDSDESSGNIEEFEIDDSGGGLVEVDEDMTSAHLGRALLKSRLAASISNKGAGYAFVSQFLYCILTLVVMLGMSSANEDEWGVRIVIAGVGVWCGGFFIITASRLRARPGPELPAGRFTFSFCLKLSMQQFLITLRSRHSLPQLFRFLCSYLFFADGMNTVQSAAFVFAQVELKMSFVELLYGLLLVAVAGVIGCVVMINVHHRLKISLKVCLLGLIVVMSIVPIYGMIALTTAAEWYMLATIFGFAIGPVQAFSRSLFSEMIPIGRDCEFFGWFEVASSGTAWLGPLCVAVVRQTTGSMRQALFSILFFYVAAWPILYTVNVEQARVEQRRASSCLEV